MKAFLLTLLLLATTCLAKTRSEQYLEWHRQCLYGDKATIDARIADFENRLHQDPSDQLARAYLGSAHALRSRASFWGPTKLKHLKEGQKLLNSSVAAEPNNPRVRMVRAIGFYHVPPKFGMRPAALADFAILTPKAKKTSSTLSKNERQAILYYAYLAHKEAGTSKTNELRKAAHTIAPHTWYGQQTN